MDACNIERTAPVSPIVTLINLHPAPTLSSMIEMLRQCDNELTYLSGLITRLNENDAQEKAIDKTLMDNIRGFLVITAATGVLLGMILFAVGSAKENVAVECAGLLLVLGSLIGPGRIAFMPPASAALNPSTYNFIADLTDEEKIHYDHFNQLLENLYNGFRYKYVDSIDRATLQPIYDYLHPLFRGNVTVESRGDMADRLRAAELVTGGFARFIKRKEGVSNSFFKPAPDTEQPEVKADVIARVGYK